MSIQVKLQRKSRASANSKIANSSPSRASHSPPNEHLRRRAKDLLATEIHFIANKTFYEAGEDPKTPDTPVAVSESSTSTRSADVPGDLPAHLRRMCEARLLSAEEERSLFRRMNYFKFRANVVRATLNSDNPRLPAIEEVDRLLTAANKVRDQIIHANVRLVISIVRKFVTPQNSFDEMLSDGIMTLMNAVEKFDYDRGFRFSTYAYRSVARNAYRAITDRRKENARFTTNPDEVSDAEEQRTTAGMDEHTWEVLRGTLSQMLVRLDKRERFIVRCRYALGKNRKITTFQALADKLGISKERVRQLEQRAVGKLRCMTAELPMDFLEPLSA